MPTCITLNSNVDFTVTSLSAPQDGYSISITQATPTPTPGSTPIPTGTPAPSPSETPLPTPSDTPVPTASTTPIPTGTPAPSPSETPLPTPSETPLPTSTPAPSGGPTPLSGSTDPCAPTAWPAYGSGNQYEVTLTAGSNFTSSTYQWFQLDGPNRTMFIPNAQDVGGDSSGIRRAQYIDDDCNMNYTTQNLVYSTVTGTGEAMNAVTLIGLAYGPAGSSGPWNVYFA